MAKERGLTVRQETFEALSALVGHARHQGVALRSHEFRYTPLETMLERPIEKRQPLLALDSVQDPQNLGALIRSACFLGVKGMILPKDRSAGISATVIKIASGAAAYLPVVQVVNLAQTLERLKESGLWVVGMDVEGASGALRSGPFHASDAGGGKRTEGTPALNSQALRPSGAHPGRRADPVPECGNRRCHRPGRSATPATGGYGKPASSQKAPYQS